MPQILGTVHLKYMCLVTIAHHTEDVLNKSLVHLNNYNYLFLNLWISIRKKAMTVAFVEFFHMGLSGWWITQNICITCLVISVC